MARSLILKSLSIYYSYFHFLFFSFYSNLSYFVSSSASIISFMIIIVFYFSRDTQQYLMEQTAANENIWKPQKIWEATLVNLSSPKHSRVISHQTLLSLKRKANMKSVWVHNRIGAKVSSSISSVSPHPTD